MKSPPRTLYLGGLGGLEGQRPSKKRMLLAWAGDKVASPGEQEIMRGGCAAPNPTTA